MVMKKVTVKTTDGQIHKYDKVKIVVEDDNIVIHITNRKTIVFPLENVIFYSFES